PIWPQDVMPEGGRRDQPDAFPGPGPAVQGNIGQQVQRRFDLVQVFMPRGGQRNAAAAAIEQGLAQGGFQLADALADRAGGDAEFFGGRPNDPNRAADSNAWIVASEGSRRFW